MKRHLILIMLALLPALMLAQKQGGEVKRPTPKHQQVQREAPVQQKSIDKGHYNSAGGFYYTGTQRLVSNPSVGNPWLLEQVKGWGKLQNGSVNASAEGVMIYDSYGYVYTSGVNQGLKDKIAEINKNHQRINDINILNNGSYVIVWGRNIFLMYGHPQVFYDRANSYFNAGEEIRSACFNQSHSWWGLVTDKHWAADESTSVIVKKAESLYGKVVSIFVSDMGRSICCENGVYCDNVPSTLYELLKTASFKPRYVKFTDDGKYIITNDQTQAWWVFF